MRKTVITLAAAATVGFGTIFGGTAVKTEAASVSSLNEEKSKIQEKRSDLNSNINQTNDKITNLQKQQADVESEKQRIDNAISDATNKINEKTTKIEETKAEVSKLQEEIKVIQERMEKRNELLKDRARSYQETGGVVNYLDVLMGSTSFSDFIGRANAVAAIVQADQEILKQQEADKKELEDKQSQLENDLASLETMVADLKKLNEQLQVQMAEKDKLLASLEAQEQEAQEYAMDMGEQEKILAAQEIAIQNSLTQEQERLAKEAAEAQKAAEAKKKAESSRASSSRSASAVTPAPAPSAAPAPAVSGGSWTRPAAGQVTSGFGNRDGGMHYGVDIAQAGPVPIVAAADGQVYVSHYSSSYGNVVYILHNVNGQTFTTVYAHMSVSMVSVGTTVKKGQQIGIMGNTGDSHGQHLHFELYKGKWARHAAIDPTQYVPI